MESKFEAGDRVESRFDEVALDTDLRLEDVERAVSKRMSECSSRYAREGG